jgi:hypothetical protein
MIETARQLAAKVAGDGALARLHRVFADMPETDRETVLQVLEREVEYRLMTRGTGDLATGYETRPNPNARIYLRILTTPETPPMMDREELVVANHRGLRVLRHVLGSAHAAWRDAMAEAAGMLEPRERTAARQVLQETIAALDAADEQARESSPTTPEAGPAE